MDECRQNKICVKNPSVEAFEKPMRNYKPEFLS